MDQGTQDLLRSLIAVGLLLLLVLLRLDAERFGAAEYDEPGPVRGPRLRLRLTWYALGLVLVGLIYVIHPTPRDSLSLTTGRRTETILFGLLLAGLGMLQAAGFAWYRYHDLRLPPTRAYPDAVLNAVATAFIDEATFRAVLLGLLFAAGLDPHNTGQALAAILIQAVVYVLATRTARRGRHPYTSLLALGIGVFCGWATWATGGIGAAFFGHAVTRLSVFVCTGHAGQVVRRGREPEEIEQGRRPPAGWQYAGRSWRDGRPEAGEGRPSQPQGRAGTRTATVQESAEQAAAEHAADEQGPGEQGPGARADSSLRDPAGSPRVRRPRS